MSRLQLAINVTDVDKAIGYYARLFDTAPAKVKPGFANFTISDPPLKRVLLERQEVAPLNHRGVDVEMAEEVVAAEVRLRGAGLETTGGEDTICCYAEKTETWMSDPDGARWEWYVRSVDAGQLHKQLATTRPQPAAGDSRRREPG